MHAALERHSNAIVALVDCLKLRASLLVGNFDYFVGCYSGLTAPYFGSISFNCKCSM